MPNRCILCNVMVCSLGWETLYLVALTHCETIDSFPHLPTSHLAKANSHRVRPVLTAHVSPFHDRWDPTRRFRFKNRPIKTAPGDASGDRETGPVRTGALLTGPTATRLTRAAAQRESKPIRDLHPSDASGVRHAARQPISEPERRRQGVAPLRSRPPGTEIRRGRPARRRYAHARDGLARSYKRS